MKKALWITVMVLALTTGVVGTAYAAEAAAPPGPGWAGPADEEGPLHDLMVEAAADLLGLEPDDLEARLDGGETVLEIALDLGLDVEVFRAEWAEARRAVIESAVEDGLIDRLQIRRMLGLRRHLRHGECLGVAGAESGALND